MPWYVGEEEKDGEDPELKFGLLNVDVAMSCEVSGSRLWKTSGKL